MSRGLGDVYKRQPRNLQSKKWKLLIFERQDNEIFYAATLVENDCAPEMIFLQTTYRQHLKNSKPSRASQRQDERLLQSRR